MAKFRTGQEVTKKDRKEWHTIEGTGLNGQPPVFGKIYTVNESEDFMGLTFITFKELHPEDGFDDRDFELVMPSEKITELLKEQQESA